MTLRVHALLGSAFGTLEISSQPPGAEVSFDGRPVGVTVAPDGSLLVADDSGGKVWRVSAKR